MVPQLEEEANKKGMDDRANDIMACGENSSSREMDDRPKIRDHMADNKQHAMVDIGKESPDEDGT